MEMEKKFGLHRKEIIAPEESWEVDKLKTFNCIEHDKETGLCKNYDNRPDICRATSCINEDSQESIDEQHKKIINSKFFKFDIKQK